MWRFTNDKPEPERPDGRDNDKYRDVLINWGSIDTANGSAIVKLGNTTAISGVTFEERVNEVKSDENADDLRDNLLSNLANLVDLSVKYQPHSSFCFKIESNDQDAKESLIISAHFNQLLNNSSMFDLNQLIKFEDNKLIINKMIIEVLIENYDGNAFDASNLALVASILDCKLDDKHLKINNYPISTTFCFKKDDKSDEQIIYQDPCLDDEKLTSGQLNIVINAGTDDLVLLNKTGDDGICSEKLDKCIMVANKRATVISDLLKQKKSSIII